MYEISGYTDGRALAWSFRWHHACKPGRYVVHVKIGSLFHDERAEDSQFGCLADAVIDDFGNLVRVQ